MNFKIDISLPSTSKLNNDEYAQYTKSILKLLETITAEKLGVKEELITSLSKNLDLLTEASRQSRSSKESEKINLLDRKRNELLSYLLSSFKIAKKSSLQAHKESAQTLSLEFKNYKGVSNLPSRQKSQAVDALVKDLEKPHIMAHLTTLGIQHAVSSLKDINQEYQEMINTRAESQISTIIINVNKIRKETDVLYKDILRYAYASHIINSSTETTNFINLFNKLVNDTMNANKQRLAQVLANKKATQPEK